MQWMWAGLLSLVFIVLGLALVGGGVLFAVAGVQAVLDPDDTGHAIAGVLFVALGLAAIGGVLVILGLLPRAVLRLSEHKPPSLSGGGFSGGFWGGDGGGGGCGGDDGAAEESLTPGKGRIRSVPSAE